MLALFKRQYCRAHMIAYLNGELSPRARRRIAHWIDTDDVCYSEYRRQRAAHQVTKSDLPVFGRGDLPQFDRLWADVDAELGRPMRPETHQVARVGIVALLLTLLLAMPFAMSSASAASNAATQPSPRTRSYTFDTTRTAQNMIFIAEIVVINTTDHEQRAPLEQRVSLEQLAPPVRPRLVETTVPPLLSRVAEPQFAEVNTAPRDGAPYYGVLSDTSHTSLNRPHATPAP